MRAVELILRAEHLAIFVAGVVGYVAMGGEALWLIPALLAPDLSIVGYLVGPRVGAVTYNAAHNLVVSLGLLAIGWFAAIAFVALAGAALTAHVGMDRTLGYGLKLPSGFQDTHLGRIGR